MSAVPPWLDRVQFLLFYAFNPCDAEASLYVEMAKAPAGRLALLLVEPDLKEIVQTFFTPKGLRSKRHGRKGRKGGDKGRGGIPDINELVGSNLPGAKDAGGRRYGSGTRAFFTGINTLDRVTWPLVLIDEVTNAAFDTFTGVMLEQKEQCDHIGRMRKTRESDVLQELLGWNAANLHNEEYIVGMSSSSGFTAMGVNEGTYSVTWAAGFHNPQPFDVSVEMRLVRSGVSGVLDHVGPLNLGPGDTKTLICAARVTEGVSFGWQMKSNGGTLGVFDLECFAMQIDGSLL
jgi:hypothetical protein